MAAEEPARNESASDVPPIGSTALWYWVAGLIVLFMGIVVVMAVIQSQAQ
jgi:hypothetical protein